MKISLKIAVTISSLIYISTSCSDQNAEFVSKEEAKKEVVLEVETEDATNSGSDANGTGSDGTGSDATGNPADGSAPGEGSTASDEGAPSDSAAPASSADATVGNDTANSKPVDPKEVTESSDEDEEVGTEAGEEIAGKGNSSNGNGKGKDKKNGTDVGSDEVVGEGEEGEENEENADDKISKADLAICGEKHKIGENRIHIVGTKKVEKIEFNSVVAIKLTGNKPVLDLQLNGEEGAKVKAVCIFSAGNQSSSLVKISGVSLENILFIGRGNQSNINIEVDEGGSLGQGVADLKGNRSRLEISGEGDYSCENFKVTGKISGFICGK